jgi:hypothetical protein
MAATRGPASLLPKCTQFFLPSDLVPSAEIYVEVILKPSAASANQAGSKDIIIVKVPRSQIESHRAEHQAQEVAIDRLIAQALAEKRASDISQRVGLNLIERSRSLSERPRILEGRAPEYDCDGFKGWIL